MQTEQHAPSPYQTWNWKQWPAGFSMPAHQHDFLQSIHVIEGCLEIDWGTGWQRCYPGEVHLLPPNHSHALRTIDGHKQFGLNWRPADNSRNYLSTALELISKPQIIEAPQALHQLTELEQEHRQAELANHPLQHFAVCSALDTYVHNILTLLLRHQQHQQHPWQTCLALIDSLLTSKVTVNALCKRLHCSRSSLQRLSHKHAGCGIIEVHAQRRCQAAAHHLAHFPGTIAACAERFGFNDQAEFSRTFKRYMGLSPRSYRQRAHSCTD